MSDTPKVIDGCSRGLNRDAMDQTAQVAPLGPGAVGVRWRSPAAGRTGELPCPGASPAPCGTPAPHGSSASCGSGAPCGSSALRGSSGSRGTPAVDGCRVVGGGRGQGSVWGVRAHGLGGSGQVPQIRAKTATRRYVGNSTNLGWLRLVA
jgi:hypothetical protein